MEHANWWFYRLGFEDYHPAIFVLMPLSLVAIYHVTACYLLYGIKRMMLYNISYNFSFIAWIFNNGFYTNYSSIPMSFASKTNPDAHYSQQYGKYNLNV